VRLVVARSSHAFAPILCASDSLAEVRLGWFCLPLFEAQFPTKSEILGPVCRLIGIRPEALFDRFKRVGDGAFARLGFRQKPHKVSDVSVRSGLE
jgi:hypothetical protein